MVYIILLNWNGGHDTIQCMESIFRSNYPHYRVIVCDNRSSDDSMQKMKVWAEGIPQTEENIHDTLTPLIHPPVSKPIPYLELRDNEADIPQTTTGNHTEFPLVFIQNTANNGYSAGNNPGIRFALQNNADYIWLLNNDTIIKNNTLAELVNHMETNEKTGLLGAAIYFAANPGQIQTMGGGRINPITGLDTFINSPAGLKANLNYITGTSLFMRKEVPEQIGLLDESFFFYWEDVDFSKRSLEKGYQLAVAENAVVYHKFSATVGSQSLKSDLFKVGSLIRYFKKHHNIRWPFPVIFNITGMVVNRILRKQFTRVIPILNETLRAIFRK